MSGEDLTNYKTYISDLDITKYIVLDGESNYWYSAEYVDKMLKKQGKEIERLENIIKEVREWANKTIFYFDFEEEITKHAFDLLYTKQGQELLEILDKENKNE